MLRILLTCACISIIVDMSLSDSHHRKTAWIEGAAIFNAVLVVSLVGSYNDWAKEVQFVKLQKLSAEKQKVNLDNSSLPYCVQV